MGEELLPPASGHRRLNPKPSWRKVRFAIAFVRTGSRRLAALEGLRASPKSAVRTGHRYMADPFVRQTVMELQRRAIEEAAIDLAWVLRELALIYRTSIAEFLDVAQSEEDGRWGMVHRFDLKNAPPDLLSRVQEIRIDEKSGAVTIKLPDKLRTLELIGRHVDVSAWEDKATVELRNADDLVDRILQGRARNAARLKVINGGKPDGPAEASA